MLFQLIIIITSVLSNTYALNKLVALPLSITSRIESKNFYRNQNIPFSFLNFTDMGHREDLTPDENDLIASRNASFLSYSTEFTSIIGFNPQLTLIEQRQPLLQFAHEGGAYIPETNEVWFTANQLPVQNTNISSLQLLTNQIDLLDIYPPIVTPNGVNYFEGYAYVCSQGNKTTPAAIYAVNPTTRISRLIVNSWFGLKLNSPNDITFSTKIAGKKFMWFTDPTVAFMQGFSNAPQYHSTVFRYDILTSELLPVITSLIIPNGIAFNQNETVLYVSDTSPDNDARIVYAYDINADGLPINRRIFSISSLGIPDGIRVDKNDRVWTAEGDGINIRDSQGRLLGVILGHDLCVNGVISNFALVKNTVIILAQESLWRLNLTTDVL
jgi:gluconolactonase